MVPDTDGMKQLMGDCPIISLRLICGGYPVEGAAGRTEGPENVVAGFDQHHFSIFGRAWMRPFGVIGHGSTDIRGLHDDAVLIDRVRSLVEVGIDQTIVRDLVPLDVLMNF